MRQKMLRNQRKQMPGGIAAADAVITVGFNYPPSGSAAVTQSTL